MNTEKMLDCALIGICVVNLPNKVALYIVLSSGRQNVLIFFLISPQKHMLWVLVRIISVRQFI